MRRILRQPWQKISSERTNISSGEFSGMLGVMGLFLGILGPLRASASYLWYEKMEKILFSRKHGTQHRLKRLWWLPEKLVFTIELERTLGAVQTKPGNFLDPLRLHKWAYIEPVLETQREGLSGLSLRLLGSFQNYGEQRERGSFPKSHRTSWMSRYAGALFSQSDPLAITLKCVHTYKWKSVSVCLHKTKSTFKTRTAFCSPKISSRRWFVAENIEVKMSIIDEY